ncbi:hypothetical protein VSR82_37445 [Burkholderia sp. JPY481]|uniref:hypothetical protein n=1 Tax=unclassified Paraburkholderia TaxID=2615204 RepID=UPI003176EEC5
MDYMQNPHLADLSAAERKQAIEQATKSRTQSLKLSVWGSLVLVAVMIATIVVEKLH